MSLMDINFATGLRAKLEENHNKALLTGASIALSSFSALQKNISIAIEGLTNFEEHTPSCCNSKSKSKR